MVIDNKEKMQPVKVSVNKSGRDQYLRKFVIFPRTNGKEGRKSGIVSQEKF